MVLLTSRFNKPKNLVLKANPVPLKDSVQRVSNNVIHTVRAQVSGIGSGGGSSRGTGSGATGGDYSEWMPYMIGGGGIIIAIYLLSTRK